MIFTSCNKNFKPSGFAFVEFEDSRDAEDAVRALDGTKISGSKIRVEMSSGRKRREDGRRGGDDGRRGGGSGGPRRDDRRGGRYNRFETEFLTNDDKENLNFMRLLCVEKVSGNHNEFLAQLIYFNYQKTLTSEMSGTFCTFRELLNFSS